MPPSQPIQPIRVLVIGTCGSGKTFFAHQLAQLLDCPHIEMDSLYWGPDWQAVAPEVFAASVHSASTGECWVADGNYSATRHVLWPRATHVVWLNYSRWTVLSRLIGRTLSSALSRKPLYNGNRESLRTAFFSKKSVILWSIRTHRSNQARYRLLRDDPAFAHLHWTELRQPRHTAAVMDVFANAAKHKASPFTQNEESR